jgi:pimeloyl-ACP methyl ester carboxylesterase
MKDDPVVVDPDMATRFLKRPPEERQRSLWVFRYYDLDDRTFETYASALKRLIEIVRTLTGAPKVNIIAHSMGGLIVRHTVQTVLQAQAREWINKIVTLGTPHRGIDFQVVKRWFVSEAHEELEAFNPGRQADPENPAGYTNFAKHFPLERLLCVIGTNYRTYSVGPAVVANRLLSIGREGSWAYNRSDGLVSQQSAYIDDAHRAFVHKCHGGYDSLVTAREPYEIATRFFSGTHRARLLLKGAEIRKGKDWFGKSEFYIGVSVKPRNLDFELWHQSKEAENCYGPYSDAALKTLEVGDPIRDRYRGMGEDGELMALPFDLSKSLAGDDIVFRLECYVGERDTYGVGFSDQVILNQQCFLQAKMEPGKIRLIHHPTAAFGVGPQDLGTDPAAWEFTLGGPGAPFEGKFAVEFGPWNPE